MDKITDIENNKKKKQEIEKKVRDILRPICDEELSEEEYPVIKKDENLE